MFDIEKDLMNAPSEVKNKLTAASMAHKRYQKSVEQCSLWSQEKELSRQAHMAAQGDWTECLNRWDPNTNTLKEKELIYGQ